MKPSGKSCCAIKTNLNSSN